MGDHSEAFVGFDTSKLRHAVAVAESGRTGEVRFLGEIENSDQATAKLEEAFGQARSADVLLRSRADRLRPASADRSGRRHHRATAGAKPRQGNSRFHCVADRNDRRPCEDRDSPGRNPGTAAQIRESELDHRRLRLRPSRCTTISATHSGENRMEPQPRASTLDEGHQSDIHQACGE